jgi:hypothetical protein
MMLGKYAGAFSAILMTLVPSINQNKVIKMNPCTPSIEPAITVTVSDARTGVPLEATVMVKAGNFQEQLNLQGVTAAGQVIYGGVFERPGIYTVTASKEGYETSTLRGIRVTKDACHVVTRELKVLLKSLDR